MNTKQTSQYQSWKRPYKKVTLLTKMKCGEVISHRFDNHAQLQLIHISTPIATRPVHLVPVRDVSSSRFTIDWELVTSDRLSRMVAHICRQLLARGGGGEGGAGKDSVSTSTAASPAQPPSTEHPIDKASNLKVFPSQFMSKPVDLLRRSQEATPDEADLTSTVDERASLTATLEDDPDDIDSLFAEFESNHRRLISESGGDQEDLLTHSIHLVDSGGQPQFHKVLSIFLPGLSGCIAVFKLSEYLMPCVLDLSCIYPSPQVADGFIQDSFILLFPKHCAMLGIFCAACSFLLRDSGWRLLTECGEVVQVAWNSIAFAMPRGCGHQVTLKDPLSSYLEVSVELPTHLRAVLSHTL